MTAQPFLQLRCVLFLWVVFFTVSFVSQIGIAYDGRCTIAPNTLPTQSRTFQGLEVLAVRELGHVEDATLRTMSEHDFAPRTINGDRIVLHHYQRNRAGFIVEMPVSNHSVGNVCQHPFINTRGGGLFAEQRASLNKWRTDYLRTRAQDERSRRGAL
jgi:hypothetical protein